MSGLYRRLCALHFLHVRAPPASGKSTLLNLLQNYIYKHNPAGLPIYVVTLWYRNRLELEEQQPALGNMDQDDHFTIFLNAHSGVPTQDLWKHWLNYSVGFDLDAAPKGYWLLIDEGQTSYRDLYFWNDCIKSVDETSPGHIIVFSSYGSPGANPLANEKLKSPHFVRSITPIFVSGDQRISLQPRAWSGTLDIPGDQGLGLLLSLEEYRDVVDRWCNSKRSSTHRRINFAQDLLDALYCFTQGHVGVVKVILNALYGGPHVRSRIAAGETLFLRHLQEALFITPTLHHQLLQGIVPAARCLPTVSSYGDADEPSLQEPRMARMMKFLLAHKRIRESHDIGLGPSQVDPFAVGEAFIRGWIHADLDPHHHPHGGAATANPSPTNGPGQAEGGRVYVLPSRFHEWYVSCVLTPPHNALVAFPTLNQHASTPPRPRGLRDRYPTPLSLLLDVVRRFKPSQLRGLGPMGPGSKHRPYEAVYRDEWYRAASGLFPDVAIRIIPEFNYSDQPQGLSRNKLGWIDFHIPFARQGESELTSMSNIASEGIPATNSAMAGYTYEFLREGFEVDEHVARFGPEGRYTSWLPAGSEWMVVDFRTSRPRRKRVALSGRLVHVCFMGLEGGLGGNLEPPPAVTVAVVDVDGAVLGEWVLIEAP